MRRSAGSIAVALALTFVPAVAHATDAQTCVDASDKAQRARAAGQLREAQKQLLLCVSDSCPAIVRRDCAQWQSDITSIAPTVVFGAKDRAGHDLVDVIVTIDGQPLAQSLDGKSISVDPGLHVFRFQTPDRLAVTERVLVKEGEKSRVINVVIGPEPAPAAPPRATVEPPEEERHHTVWPWIVVGVGGAAVVASVVLMVTRPSLPQNCSAETSTCTRAEGESSASYADDQNQATNHVNRPTIALPLGAVGLATIAGGLIWHFLEPTGPRPKAAFQVVPWRTADGSGISALGTF